VKTKLTDLVKARKAVESEHRQGSQIK